MSELALKRKHYDRGTMVPFIVIHASVLLVFTVPFRPALLAWLAGSYFLRMFGVTGGYHRYFSHRSFKHEPLLAVLDGVPRPDQRAEGRALVGGASPRSPPALGPQGRPPLARARRLLVVAPRLDSLRRVRRRSTRSGSPTSAAIPELRWLDRFHLVPGDRVRRRDLLHRRLGRVRLGYSSSPPCCSTTARS